MRKQSIAVLIAAACVLSADGAPTLAPGERKLMGHTTEVLRLPPHQTACIVDIVQNNTDPETHLVSRDVEMLLTRCFAVAVPRCPEDNPNCLVPESDAAVEVAPAETMETARADVKKTKVVPKIPKKVVVKEVVARADTAPQAEDNQQSTETPASTSVGVPPQSGSWNEVQATGQTSSQTPAKDSEGADAATTVMGLPNEIQATTATPGKLDGENGSVPMGSARSDDAEKTGDTTQTAARADEADAPTAQPAEAGAAQSQGAHASHRGASHRSMGRRHGPGTSAARHHSQAPATPQAQEASSAPPADAGDATTPATGDAKPPAQEQAKEGDTSGSADSKDPKPSSARSDDSSPTTETAARADEPSATTEKVARADEPSATTEKVARADEPITSTEKVARSEEPSTSTEKEAQSDEPGSSTEKVARSDEFGTSTEKVAGSDEPTPTTERVARSEEPITSTEKVARSEDPSPTTETVARSDGFGTSTEKVAGSDEPSLTTENAARADEPKRIRADTLAPQQAKERSTRAPDRIDDVMVI